MSGPLLKGGGGKIIYAGYSASTSSMTGGGVSPIFTETIDVYAAGASGIYTFPKAMRARVVMTGQAVAANNSSNAYLYPWQNGGLVLPTNYGRDYYVASTAGECYHLKVDIVWDFVVGNIIGPIYLCSAGSSRLGGDLAVANFIIEELQT